MLNRFLQEKCIQLQFYILFKTNLIVNFLQRFLRNYIKCSNQYFHSCFYSPECHQSVSFDSNVLQTNHCSSLATGSDWTKFTNCEQQVNTMSRISVSLTAQVSNILLYWKRPLKWPKLNYWINQMIQIIERQKNIAFLALIHVSAVIFFSRWLQIAHDDIPKRHSKSVMIWTYNLRLRNFNIWR